MGVDQALFPKKETRAALLPRYRLAAARAANAHGNLLAVDAWHTTCNRVLHLTRNTLAHFDRLLLAYWYAYRVAAGLGSLLGYHTANLVAASLGLGDHLADLVAAGTSVLARNAMANLVAASSGLGNHLADLVATSASARFAHVLRAADLFGVAGRHPNSLAASARRRVAD